MYFCVFESEGAPHLGGTLSAGREHIVDLTKAWPQESGTAPVDVAGLAGKGPAGLETAKKILTGNAHQLPVHGLRLLAPILRPPKNVFCVGRNYRGHIIEGNIARGVDPNLFPEHIEFFTKASSTIIGHGAAIPLHAGLTAQLDYEAELGIVIGQGGCDIKAAEAESAIFGYTIVNDITGRDLQRRHGQWFKGKTLDGSCPLGPWVVHKSVVKDPQALDIKLWVNGELRQSDNTASMIFPVATVIAQLSAGLTLEPGDIIATGTPSGVGYAMKPPSFLKDGDVIAIEIESIGRLENTVHP
ncbi:fumarylacetoacetate hydrolase family protein [Pusillimonas sp. SM2304]|uniref:fumarylacetoacetate hydrolase family protein n=1 Tax=Pusillimonas sp. SM2304 TaxID=3073241 RepID=UPI002876E736|nr:fumarylacetoacetate hydrolase family protein [Pusillimonas sp. SM2304]MDS1140580.1 fumarylacetoacetate hydrolase family protein [Pusillimonas sp. SM2304]